MEKTKDIIVKNSADFSDYKYYLDIIDTAEFSLNKMPDTTIDCCKSLIEGVSKTILIALDNNYAKNNSEVDKLTKTRWFTKAINLIINLDDSMIKGEPEFLDKARVLVESIVELRNKRGDISHGKAVPKALEITSTTEFAKLVMNVTDSLLSFMLQTMFSLQNVLEKKLNYYDKKLEPFNEWVDSIYNISSVKIDQSKLLFEHVYDKYEELYYLEYLLLNEDDDVEASTPTADAKTHTIQRDLVNEFNESEFWDTRRDNLVRKFATQEKLYFDELKDLLDDYFFEEKRPLRDDVIAIMKNKPNLTERSIIVEPLIDKIIDLGNQLNILRSL